MVTPQKKSQPPSPKHKKKQQSLKTPPSASKNLNTDLEILEQVSRSARTTTPKKTPKKLSVASLEEKSSATTPTKKSQRKLSVASSPVKPSANNEQSSLPLEGSESSWCSSEVQPTKASKSKRMMKKLAPDIEKPTTKKARTEQTIETPEITKKHKPTAIFEKYKKFNDIAYARQSKVTDDDTFFEATLESGRVNVLKPKKEKLNENLRIAKEIKHTNLTYDQIKLYFKENDNHVAITNNNLTCDDQALAVYLNINDFKIKTQSMDNDDFEQEISHLWHNKLKDCVHLAQKGWLLDKTRDTNTTRKYYTLLPEWAYDLEFPEWRKPSADHTKVPMASWFYVKESSINNGSIGVFASRKFNMGELIGLFYGHRYNEENPPKEGISKWALESRYGIYDPKRGLIGSGREAPYMAMHLLVESDDDGIINATISANFLVYSTKEINIGDEISCKLNDEVWRPTSSKSPAKEIRKSQAKDDIEMFFDAADNNNVLV